MNREHSTYPPNLPTLINPAYAPFLKPPLYPLIESINQSLKKSSRSQIKTNHAGRASFISNFATKSQLRLVLYYSSLLVIELVDLPTRLLETNQSNEGNSIPEFSMTGHPRTPARCREKHIEAGIEALFSKYDRIPE